MVRYGASSLTFVKILGQSITRATVLSFGSVHRQAIRRVMRFGPGRGRAWAPIDYAKTRMNAVFLRHRTLED